MLSHTLGKEELVRVGMVALVVTAFASVGCIGTGERLSVTKVSDAKSIEKYAPRFWSAHNVPKSSGPGTKRIAVVEFTLEYVASSQPANAARGVDPDFATGLKLQLPNVLYGIFTGLLPDFDGEAVPLDDVSHSEAYHKLAGMTSSEVHALATSPDPNAGTAPMRYPVDALLCLDSEQPDTQKGLLELVREVDATGALQVRLRAGVHDGKATIEPGSMFIITTESGTGYLESKVALVSERTVAEDVLAKDLAIDSDEFAKAMKTLFRPYISMALEVRSKEH